MAESNAIMRRIDQLSELWEQFAADPAARVACWQLDEDDGRMFDLFIELQNEEASELPDLFIRFNEPFRDSEKYAFELRKSLVEKYDEIRDAIREEGIQPAWNCPAQVPGQNGIDSLIAACSTLQAAHADIVRHLAIVLVPDEIANAEAWTSWFELLIRKPIPGSVRFLTVDSRSQPRLAGLAKTYPEQVKASPVQLAMDAAYLDLLKDVPGSGPAFVFRRLFVALGNAVGAGQIDAARGLASHSARIAREQNWPHLEAVVAMTLGAAYLSRQDFDGAVQNYRSAQAIVANPADAVSKKVAMQAKFAEGSALFGAGKHLEAAAAFDEVYKLAQESGDSFGQLEGARMAAACFELGNQPQQAWQRGLQALAAAETSNPPLGANSTMPFVAQALLRVADRVDGVAVTEVRQRVEKLLGANWHSTLPMGTLS